MKKTDPLELAKREIPHRLELAKKKISKFEEEFTALEDNYPQEAIKRIKKLINDKDYAVYSLGEHKALQYYRLYSQLHILKQQNPQKSNQYAIAQMNHLKKSIHFYQEEFKLIKQEAVTNEDGISDELRESILQTKSLKLNQDIGATEDLLNKILDELEEHNEAFPEHAIKLIDRPTKTTQTALVVSPSQEVIALPQLSLKRKDYPTTFFAVVNTYELDAQTARSKSQELQEQASQASTQSDKTMLSKEAIDYLNKAITFYNEALEATPRGNGYPLSNIRTKLERLRSHKKDVENEIVSIQTKYNLLHNDVPSLVLKWK